MNYPTLMTESQVRSVTRNLEYISMEASVLSNMVDTIKGIFPEMLSNLKTAFNSTEELPKIEIKMSGEHKFIVNEIKAFPFSEYGELSTVVPEGFHGNYLDYMKVLIHSTDVLRAVPEKIIKPYYVYLSVFLSNKDAKKSTTDNEAFYKGVRAGREKLNHEIGRFFNDSDPTSKLRINKLIHNSSGIKDMFEFSELLKKQVDKVDISELNKTSRQCMDLLDIIMKQIKEGTIANVTPETTKNLANGAYEIARELEFFSVVYFRIITALSTVDNFATRLDGFIKNID